MKCIYVSLIVDLCVVDYQKKQLLFEIPQHLINSSQEMTFTARMKMNPDKCVTSPGYVVQSTCNVIDLRQGSVHNHNNEGLQS